MDYIEGEFEYKCKGSELTEEIASELVDFWQNMANDGFIYENYKTNLPKKKSAVESVISAVESKEKFWLENPIEKPIEDDYNLGDIHSGFFRTKLNQWQQAEEKTFKNPLFFVKK